MQSLVKWGYGELRNHLIDKVLKQDLSGYRYLHFCMNSNGNKKEEKPYHWTLLVFDTELDEWRHYNSLRPRDNREDPYLKDAKKIVSALHHINSNFLLCFILVFNRDQTIMQ